MSKWVKIRNKILSFFLSSAQQLYNIVRSIWDRNRILIMTELKDAAIETILELAKSDLTGDEKKERFRKIIKQTAYDIGLESDLGNSDINWLLENILKYMKNTGKIK